MQYKTIIAPHIILSLGCTHNANAAAQTTIVHAAAQAPLIRLWIIHLNGLQIGGAIEAAHSIQLPVDYG